MNANELANLAVQRIDAMSSSELAASLLRAGLIIETRHFSVISKEYSLHKASLAPAIKCQAAMHFRVDSSNFADAA